MKVAIKHNLLLLKRTPLLLICIIAFLLGVSIKESSGSFIKVIPIITFAFMVAIESLDDKKYNILFSLPITRMEYAQAKFFTLLIIYGTTTLLSIIIYIIYLLIGYTEGTDILKFAIDLFSTFPPSIIFGLIVIRMKNIVPLVIIIVLLNSISISSSNFLPIGVYKVLDALILILLLWFNRFIYVIANENCLNFYLDMEL